MDRDPYLIAGPALVSFSGGRTSAFMLHEILAAYGGELPQNVVVTFANTGKERPETLRFVHECGTRWGVDIVWLEWRVRKPWFERVGFNSASRNGEPFIALMQSKQRAPNWQQRSCTQKLKVEAMHAFMLKTFGLVPGGFTEIIGLRDDEGLRILTGMERAEKTGRRVVYPMASAKVRKADIMAFWRQQPFDLELQPWEGNCDLCFMKAKALKKRIIRDDPRLADWWIEQEKQFGLFDRRYSIRDLARQVAETPTLFDSFDPEEFDTECGLSCGVDE